MKKKGIDNETKNYLIYVLIILASVLLVVYLRTWYRAYSLYQLTIPVINGYLHEIKYDELDNYILENSNFVLYMCTSNDEECREYEREFRKIVRMNNLKDQIIYLNLNDHVKKTNNILLDSKLAVEDLMTKEIFFNSYPTISIFRDKKLHDVLIINDTITMDKVNQFLEEYEIIIKH